MSFEAKEKSVDRLLNDAIYYIPRNQRRYVWEEQNWRDLYEDIMLVVDGLAESHFLGSIVLKNEGKEDGLSKYTIIDGQQRILTLTIFLSAIMFVFKQRNMINDFGGTTKYLLATDHKNNFREIVYPEYHLSLTKLINNIKNISHEEILQYNIETFSRLCLVSEDKDKQILNAFCFFANKISEFSDEKILAIRDAIINIGYVDILSSTEEDSYTIFEILNARGIDLEDHELLKNYIMRYLRPIERRDDAKQIWSEIEYKLKGNIKDFLRHYAIHRYNYNSKNPISIYKTIQNETHGRNIDQLLDDINCKARYYNDIINPKCDNIVEYDVFSLFKTKRFKIIRPFLLSIMHKKEQKQITTEQYEVTLKFICNFFICYIIIGQERSNTLGDMLYKCAYQFETNYSNDLLEKFLCDMKKKFPPLDSFINMFKTIGWSNHWQIYRDTKCKEKCQLILSLIEKYVSNRNINIDVSIEHILPDCEDIKNAQIGNMFYLEPSLNERCANKELREKIPIYKTSSLKCPQGFANRYEKKDFLPDERTVFLARLLYNNILGISD